MIWACLVVFFLLGTAASLRADEKISMRVRLQPRVDFGEIGRSADGSSYAREADMYLRRIRLEVAGKPVERLRYALIFSADRWDQKGRSNALTLAYALADYRFSSSVNLRLGLGKLPYSRSALTSSSRQLMVERPALIGMGTGLLKYFAPHLVLYGKFVQGTVGYSFALTDGLQTGEVDKAHSRKEVIRTGDPAFAGRIELAPAGWIESRKSDSHLGQGRHLTLGLNGAFQSGLELEGMGRERRFLLGADFSFHRESVSLTGEYMYMNRASSARIEPGGWYVQGGYFIQGLKLEPAIRFATTERDANLAAQRTKVFTGGVNWYIAGHDLKVQANISHYIFARGIREVPGQGSKTGLQIQNQMYF